MSSPQPHEPPLPAAPLGRTGIEGAFESMREERGPIELAVEGELPAWLRGRFLRVGPGVLDLAGEALPHWFMGLAYLSGFDLRPDGVVFTSRLLRSRSLARALAREAHPPTLVERLLERARTLVKGRTPYDNCGVHIAQFGEDTVAMTESTHRLRIDPRSLETLGPYAYRDEMRPSVTTAHPVYDARRNRHYNLVHAFGRHSAYNLVALDGTSRTRHRVCRLPVEEPAYIHSLGATRDHIVFAEFPLRIQPLVLRFSNKSFFDALALRPEHGTRIRLVHKDSGVVERDVRFDPSFCFHHVSAREEDGLFEIDMVSFDDAQILYDLQLANVRTSPPDGTGRLRRYTIGRGRPTVRDLSDVGLELPRTDPRGDSSSAAPQREYQRFAFGVGHQAGGAPFFNQLVKIDRETGDAATWRAAGCVPSEPVFVPPPAGSNEPGVCLSLVFDTGQDRSFLLVLDGDAFQERARVPAPVRIPFPFHGDFFPAA